MIKHRVLTLGFVGIAALLAPSLARAQAPAAVPLQGVLTDANGNVLDGDFTVTLTLYDAPVGGAAFHTEVQSVPVDQGVFTVYVGESTVLDLADFVGKQPYLGIKVGADPEMSPRLRLGSVPYAAYAEYAGNIPEFPSGAVMHFDLSSCPAGWSLYGAASGRALVGTPVGGTLGGLVGMPLSNMEDRQHTHSVDPAASMSSAAGAHVHTVDPVSTATSSDGAHLHTADPIAFNTPFGGWHNHRWAVFDSAGLDWYSWDSNGGSITATSWNDGMDSAGAGEYPISSTGPAAQLYTEDASHLHSIDVPSFSTTTDGSHTHQLNVPSTTSSSVPTHTHDVDVPATVSSGATTSSVMPYVQLLACRKD
jgi:hypothetical protein